VTKFKILRKTVKTVYLRSLC